MEKLEVTLENCYGIKKLKSNFDFSDNKSTYAIYAPNGVMKTSFAKTFLDLSKDETSSDAIFPERKTKRNIKDENKAELTPEQVFVILPYVQEYESEKISTLLVNKALKEKYEKIYSKIEDKKSILLQGLETLSGVGIDEMEETISEDFTHQRKKFYNAILRIKDEVLDKEEPLYVDIKYQIIFQAQVQTFLETKDVKEKLKEYITKYEELIDSSTYFKKGIFNHNNASTIAKNLKDNGFFKANHSVILNAKKSKDIKEINTEAELEEIIQKEKDSILNNQDLKKAFEAIDKAIIRNQAVRDFRDYLEKNLFLIPELMNLDALKQKLWVSYLKENVEAYIALEEEYRNGKKEIDHIVAQANKEKTQWFSVIEEFNRRFFVPFQLSIDNQDDVILRSEVPNIKFTFTDSDGSKLIEKDELFDVLSNGERRALYILNIIFEVRARIEKNQETLFIIDDIADSFDYKNKYAIIEYLKDISQESIFKQIILTHNFDFYRSVSSRLISNRENRLQTIKTTSGVELVKETYQNNPFITWKKNFHKAGSESMLIASIPFIRNLAEFSGNESQENKLTSLLHIKPDTQTFTIKILEQSIKDVLKDKSELILNDPTKPVIGLIYEIADKIIKSKSEIIELENKIVLAIAIRLKSEEFMIKKINDPTFIGNIESNQTFRLIEKYKNDFKSEAENIELLEQVNLMTPENIHINSFMYEPIIDMANEHLKQLYIDVSLLR